MPHRVVGDMVTPWSCMNLSSSAWRHCSLVRDGLPTWYIRPHLPTSNDVSDLQLVETSQHSFIIQLEETEGFRVSGNKIVWGGDT